MWSTDSFQSYLHAIQDFDAMEMKEAKFELYRDGTRASGEPTIPNFILQKLDYLLLVTSNQGRCGLLDRFTKVEMEQDYSTLTHESCRLGKDFNM